MASDRFLHKAANKTRERHSERPEAMPVKNVFARLRNKVEATPEERLRRLSICEDCEHAIVSNIAGRDVARCGACGCPLSSRTRMRYIPGYGEVHCPKGKW